MCMKKVTVNEFVALVGLPACATQKRFLVPIAKGATPAESLAIYTNTNEYRMDKSGTRIIDPNPFEPVRCKGMLESMELGLTESATALWVKLLQNFESTVKNDRNGKAAEVSGEMASEMIRTRWKFVQMRGVELTMPRKGATHWLVRQPLEGADELCWDALERDACGMWVTEKYLYFVIPVGYRNIIYDLQEENANGIDRGRFFEANAAGYREYCQAEMDRPIYEERVRKDILPELTLKARDVATTYTQLLQDVSPQCFGDTMPLELSFDEDNEDFIYGGEPERLTVRTMEKFTELLKLLQQQVNEFMTRSRRAEGFRELLRDVDKPITIEDYYGVLDQTASSCFNKTIKVELRETDAVITVFRGNSIKEQSIFGYTTPTGASDFNAKLEKLGLKEKETDYDLYEEKGAKHIIRNLLFGLAKA